MWQKIFLNFSKVFEMKKNIPLKSFSEVSLIRMFFPVGGALWIKNTVIFLTMKIESLSSSK